MEISSRQVCDDLIELSWHVKSTMIYIAEENGLTPVQLFALHTIRRGDNSMGRVAESMHCDASNVTGVIDRLVAQGLVVRSESPTDRRTKMLALTVEGERTIKNIIDSLPARLGCAQLDAQECQVMHVVVRKLTV